MLTRTLLPGGLAYPTCCLPTMQGGAVLVLTGSGDLDGTQTPALEARQTGIPANPLVQALLEHGEPHTSVTGRRAGKVPPALAGA